MAQNIYDTSDFFAEYSKYPRAIDGLSGASEWPRLKAILPANLRQKRVLDLGCGDGWFGRWALEEGASKVDSIDVSQNMLNRAMRLGNGRAISFTRADLETLQLTVNAYDLVFSGLALHYVANIEAVFRQVYTSLKPGGSFVVSIEHPVFTAPIRPAFITGHSSNKQWLLDNYFNEGRREVNWLIQGVQKQHRTLGTYMSLLLSTGFQLTALDEWGRTEETSRKHPDWPNEGVCPRFLLLGARKPLEQ